MTLLRVDHDLVDEGGVVAAGMSRPWNVMVYGTGRDGEYGGGETLVRRARGGGLAAPRCRQPARSKSCLDAWWLPRWAASKVIA